MTDKTRRSHALANLQTSAQPPQQLFLGENRIESWRNFKARWQNYELLSGLGLLDKKLQVAQLENCLGDDALKTLSGFKFDMPSDERTPAEIIAVFESYIVGEANVNLECYKMANRQQGDGESFSGYVASLRVMVKTCDYCNDCKDSILRDRIICGIISDEVRGELLKKPKLTLKESIDICAVVEAALQIKTSLASNKVDKVKAPVKKKQFCRYCRLEQGELDKGEVSSMGKRVFQV